MIESRHLEEANVTRRRRECQRCAKRFNTSERLEETPMVVVKKDGRREAFDRSKLLAGLLRASEKRPVKLETLQAVAEQVERHLRNLGEAEVSSVAIGELVMDHLREIDGVAYVRFASVYRDFRDVAEFREQLEKLLSDK